MQFVVIARLLSFAHGGHFERLNALKKAVARAKEEGGACGSEGVRRLETDGSTTIGWSSSSSRSFYAG